MFGRDTKRLSVATAMAVVLGVSAAVAGALIGAFLGKIGRGNVAREWPPKTEEAR